MLGGTGTPQRRMTKEEAAEDMAALLTRAGIPASPEQVLALFDAHWSKLSLLAHTIHDTQPHEYQTAQEAAQPSVRPYLGGLL